MLTGPPRGLRPEDPKPGGQPVSPGTQPAIGAQRVETGRGGGARRSVQWPHSRGKRRGNGVRLALGGGFHWLPEAVAKALVPRRSSLVPLGSRFTGSFPGLRPHGEPWGDGEGSFFWPPRVCVCAVLARVTNTLEVSWPGEGRGEPRVRRQRRGCDSLCRSLQGRERDPRSGGCTGSGERGHLVLTPFSGGSASLSQCVCVCLLSMIGNLKNPRVQKGVSTVPRGRLSVLGVVLVQESS